VAIHHVINSVAFCFLLSKNGYVCIKSSQQYTLYNRVCLQTRDMLCSFSIPALPGQTNTSQTLSDSNILHAIACSRPPFPNTNTLCAPITCSTYTLSAGSISSSVQICYSILSYIRITEFSKIFCQQMVAWRAHHVHYEYHTATL